MDFRSGLFHAASSQATGLAYNKGAALWKKLGNFGDCKTLQERVCELRIHYGPGIRIYYGKIGNTIEELTIINPKGELMTLSPSHPLFHYIIGGYGCFGIIVKAAYRTRLTHKKTKKKFYS